MWRNLKAGSQIVYVCGGVEDFGAPLQVILDQAVGFRIEGNLEPSAVPV